jgi:hypothetical protein
VHWVPVGQAVDAVAVLHPPQLLGSVAVLLHPDAHMD